MIYLIDYDRRSGSLHSLDLFPEEKRLEAEECRLAKEIELLGLGITREIVLLEASSIDELRKTHRRYFEKLENFLQSETGTP